MAILNVKGLEVLIDDDDLSKIPTKLHLMCRDRYVGFSQHSKPFYLHRFLLGITDSRVYVDHINGNGLDNRKSNLRICTMSQNLANRSKEKSNKSGFKGVFLHSQYHKWMAQICFQRKKMHLGCFDTPEEAHAAYSKKAMELFGEFARVE